MAAATDLTSDGAPGAIGPEEPYRSGTYMIRAHEAPDTEPTGDAPIDIAPTLVNWPADAPVGLAAASDCAEVPANRFSELFGHAASTGSLLLVLNSIRGDEALLTRASQRHGHGQRSRTGNYSAGRWACAEAEGKPCVHIWG